MKLENLYHIKFNSPPDTTGAHICAVMMVEEQRRTCILLLTEWQEADCYIRMFIAKTCRKYYPIIVIESMNFVQRRS